MSAASASALTILAPLAIEARAARAGAPRARVLRSGMGAARSRAFTPPRDAATLLVAGFAGGLDAALAPGDVVLATALVDPAGARRATLDPSALAALLRRAGLRVALGPIASSERLVTGARRRALRDASGALAVDMESFWLAAARPPAVLRVVLDTGARELVRPRATARGVRVAYRTLRRACALTEEWAASARAAEPENANVVV